MTAMNPSFHEWAKDRIIALSNEYESLKKICDQCGRRYIGKMNHDRVHTFCSDKCRCAFRNENASREKQAEYMRSYRARRKMGT